MNTEKMDSSAVYSLFEEIKDRLDKQAERKAIPVQPTVAEATICLEDAEKIEHLTESLDNVSEKLNCPLKHHHTIDFMSNKALIALTVVVIAFMASVVIIKNQRVAIKQFRDNDLKYRYIQMKGRATPEDILMLREVFEFNRNADSIKVIRRRVERYEQLIQEQAETEARARLNAEQADRLQQQVEKLKK